MFRITDDIRAELRAGLGVFALSFVLMAIVTSFLMGWQGLVSAFIIAVIVTLFCIFPIIVELLLTAQSRALHWLGRAVVVLAFAVVGGSAGGFLMTRLEGEPGALGMALPVIFALGLGAIGARMRVLGLKY
jgi:hypothetical protein